MMTDAAARLAALDPSQSFAVQAPAGSGKTTLLTQRLLRLLTTVEAPEQVVAITFTRKAAEEMRARIVTALELARGPEPTESFLAATYQLAREVLAHDAVQGWQLSEQPSRLRIMTIDALSQHIVRQMPITAGLAGPRAIEENATTLYRNAARDALATLADTASSRRGAIVEALIHLDNDWAKLENLLAVMLSRRDQGLAVSGTGDEQALLESFYGAVVEEVLISTRALFTPGLAAELVAVASYAGRQLAATEGGNLAQLAELRAMPVATPDGLAAWQALASLFLKSDGDYRRQLTKVQGFPPGKGEPAAMKARLLAVIETLAGEPRALPLLQRVRKLPATLYSSGEWTVVLALLDLLKTATAHLMVEGERTGRVDFTAFSLAALQALGEPEQPTDLALSMDYRVQHLLIDEFQDTSSIQFELIERLTAGWTGDDGRSLFLVGDPMQSIYRFRQADVALFLRVLSERRIGHVALVPLALQVNFRAQAALVDWINAAVPPALAEVAAFDLRFVPQTAVHPANGIPCALYPVAVRDNASEAARVLSIVQTIRQDDPQASIAILVRSRTHLGQITASLVEAGIPLAAREIRPLLALPVACDLFALTRALIHEADSVAWFAVLRAPWCGLSLAALTTLAAWRGSESTVRGALHRALAGTELASDDVARLHRVARILERAVRELACASLPLVVERTWLLLGGPAEFDEPAQAADAQAYFTLLEAVVREHPLVTAERIGERMAERYSTPPAAPAGAVQVMTMHRAKGLEFDHVIIPGLGRRPRPESRRLLMWRERRLTGDIPTLLLAPIPAKGHSPLYEYLRFEEQRDIAAETVRLLYVAVTRARRRLHLLGHLRADTPGGQNVESRVEKGSLLALLWPFIGADFMAAAAGLETGPPAQHHSVARPQSLLRRRSPAHLPAPPDDERGSDANALPPLVEFDWAGSTARHVGTVIHRLLQRAGDIGDYAETKAAGLYVRGQLRGLGVPRSELEAAAAQVEAALARALASERGRWLMSTAHHDVRAEWRLSHQVDALREHVVIDRSFIDARGTRWIVDFKTGQHAGSGLETYLESEVERYRPQLERYARIVASLEVRSVRLGLYFPLLDAWREWPYVPS